MKGLLIEIIDWQTGKRPEGIDLDNHIRDGVLMCYNGTYDQALDHNLKGDFEIRVVEDEKEIDLSQFNGEIILEDDTVVMDPTKIDPVNDNIIDVNGVVVLPDEETIENIYNVSIPEEYKPIESNDLSTIINWLEQNNISVPSKNNTGLDKKYRTRVLKKAKDNGCNLVKKSKPKKIF